MTASSSSHKKRTFPVNEEDVSEVEYRLSRYLGYHLEEACEYVCQQKKLYKRLFDWLHKHKEVKTIVLYAYASDNRGDLRDWTGKPGSSAEAMTVVSLIKSLEDVEYTSDDECSTQGSTSFTDFVSGIDLDFSFYASVYGDVDISFFMDAKKLLSDTSDMIMMTRHHLMKFVDTQLTEFSRLDTVYTCAEKLEEFETDASYTSDFLLNLEPLPTQNCDPLQPTIDSMFFKK